MIGAIVFRISMVLTILVQLGVFVIFKDRMFEVFEQLKIPLPGLTLSVLHEDTLILVINVLAVLLCIFLGAFAFKGKLKLQMVGVGVIVCLCTFMNMVAVASLFLPILPIGSHLQ